MSAIKPVKRYTHDAIGIVLDIRPRVNHQSGIRYKEVEFDDYRIAVPWYIANTIEVGDNIHAYFVNPHWTKDMAALEQAVTSLSRMANHVFQDDNVTLGYCELLDYLDVMHHGFWVVKHI